MKCSNNVGNLVLELLLCYRPETPWVMVDDTWGLADAVRAVQVLMWSDLETYPRGRLAGVHDGLTGMRPVAQAPARLPQPSPVPPRRIGEPLGLKWPSDEAISGGSSNSTCVRWDLTQGKLPKSCGHPSTKSASLTLEANLGLTPYAVGEGPQGYTPHVQEPALVVAKQTITPTPPEGWGPFDNAGKQLLRTVRGEDQPVGPEKGTDKNEQPEEVPATPVEQLPEPAPANDEVRKIILGFFFLVKRDWLTGLGRGELFVPLGQQIGMVL